jgi:hypothetical protein
MTCHPELGFMTMISGLPVSTLFMVSFPMSRISSYLSAEVIIGRSQSKKTGQP